MHSQQHILDAIGNTPLVELRRIVPPGSARIVAKLESANPTGSMKDRLARMIVERAAAAGRLPPGGTVVEYTAGTTGISLALVATLASSVETVRISVTSSGCHSGGRKPRPMPSIL